MSDPADICDQKQDAYAAMSKGPEDAPPWSICHHCNALRTCQIQGFPDTPEGCIALPWIDYRDDPHIESGSYVVWTTEGWLAAYFDGWIFECDGENIDADVTHYLPIFPP